MGFDRFGRRKRSLWKNGSSGAIYYDARPAYDENANTTAVENAWVTPWSSTYESDGLNRLKGLKFGVMTSGSISTVVQQEDWQTGGALKLDQVGNWIDYARTRESAAQDDWAGNTFNKINVYTKVDKVTGTDIEPEVDKKGLPKWDDKTGGTTVGYQYVFDAWDRLRLVKNTSAVLVEEFRYNGLGHRIAWHYDINASGGAPDGSDDWVHFQYNERWQQMAMYVGTATSPDEVFTYMAAGKDGYGGSSYIDEVVMRERGAERYYYLQNWRHDVVAIMNYDGEVKEKLVYDAYGRPHAFSPGDLKTSGGADRPDGALDTSDTWTTGGVVWNKDIGNSAHKAIPDGVTSNGTSDTDDPVTLTNLKNAGYSAGYGIISDATINNRKGLAGYEFDPVLEGDASANYKPVYHVRHRVLASDTGKWFQKDPLGYHDGMDLYEYCKSDPVDDADATGTCTLSTCLANPARADITIRPSPSSPVPDLLIPVSIPDPIITHPSTYVRPKCDGSRCDSIEYYWQIAILSKISESPNKCYTFTTFFDLHNHIAANDKPLPSVNGTCDGPCTCIRSFAGLPIPFDDRTPGWQDLIGPDWTQPVDFRTSQGTFCVARSPNGICTCSVTIKFSTLKIMKIVTPGVCRDTRPINVSHSAVVRLP